jgi:hypothetical protein
MVHKAFPILIVAALATAACNGDRNDTVMQDTTFQVVPDTIGIERTVTEDTIWDLDRDTARTDTLRRDTMPR